MSACPVEQGVWSCTLVVRGVLFQNGEQTVVAQASLENEAVRLVDWRYKVGGISAGLS